MVGVGRTVHHADDDSRRLDRHRVFGDRVVDQLVATTNRDAAQGCDTGKRRLEVAVALGGRDIVTGAWSHSRGGFCGHPGLGIQVSGAGDDASVRVQHVQIQIFCGDIPGDIHLQLVVGAAIRYG